jgi:ribonuclease E
LNQAGLLLIETSAGARPAEPIVMPTQALGRKPKPAPVIASEPLQMVETRHE